MERKIEQTLLYDFYGELLTEHQRTVYEDFVLYDLSLSEIATERGISRQGVHDLVKRSDKILEGYEEKLGLLKRFQTIKEKTENLNKLLIAENEQIEESVMEKMKQLLDEIIEEM